MKAQTLSTALFMGLFCGSALASIHVTNNPDGTIQAVYSVADDAASLFKRDCTANNCVRAMKARPDAATSFCRSFTAAANTDVAPFTQCVGAPKASSACSCLVPKTTSTSTSTTETPSPTAVPCNPPGGHCTITDFGTACCKDAYGNTGCYFGLTGDINNGQCFLPTCDPMYNDDCFSFLP